jgi:acetylornithine/succinyldiaminopimelate/putrescine aminotransferase
MSLAEPIFAEKGEGAWLVDAEGKKLLDFANGGAVPLGYTSGAKTGDSPPEGTGPRSGVENTPRVCPQHAARGAVPVFASVHALGADGVTWRSEVELMHKLAELIPGGMNRRVLVCESGREALARAIELARAETNRTNVTYLSACSEDKPAIGKDVAAVVAHPLDGRIKHARQACDAAGALLIDDEAGLGPGATGRMFAIELSEVRPDIYVLGRGWAAGFPFGACVTRSSSLRWKSATAGNPVGCTLALETISLLEAGLLEQGRKLAAYLEKRFGALSSPKLAPELWGIGLVRTIVFRKSKDVAKGFVQKCREPGLLLQILSADTVGVRPPLVASEKDVDFAAEVVGKVLAGFDKKA